MAVELANWYVLTIIQGFLLQEEVRLKFIKIIDLGE